MQRRLSITSLPSWGRTPVVGGIWYALVERGERDLDARRIQAQGVGRGDVGEKGAAEIVAPLVVHDLPSLLIDHEVMAQRWRS